MRYTIPKTYPMNVGTTIEIPDNEWKAIAKEHECNSTEAIKRWMVENDYQPASILEDNKQKAKKKRAFKIDEEKAAIIELLFKALVPEVDDAEISNPNRLITFSIGDSKYDLTLARKKK